MQTQERRGRRLHRMVGMGLLIALIAGLGSRGGPLLAGPGAAPAADLPGTGAVYALALDDNGNGWAWGAPRNDLDSPHLLRLAGGTWQDASATPGAATLLAHTQELTRLAVTADGHEAWAIGDDANYKPLLWHAQDETWTQIPLTLTGNDFLGDLVLSADGQDGFIAGMQGDNPLLWRLIQGKWLNFAAPPNTGLQNLAISPDGDTVWAGGYRNNSSAPSFWRLDGLLWTELPSDLGEADYIAGLMVDNSEQGWALLPSGTPGGTLVRLTISTTTALAPTLDPDLAATEPTMRYFDGRIDAQGRGWITGVAEATADPIRGNSETPVLLRVDGEGVTQVATGLPTVGESEAFTVLYPIGLSRNGAYGWLPSFDSEDVRFQNLVPLVEPWAHDAPAAAPPVPGSAPGQCFAAVPYCLRGLFAAAWAKNGGLDQFGYPITPEVIEAQGTMTYTVQYTQRARFEYHPEFAGTANEVLLGLLGNALADPRQGETPFQPTPAEANPQGRWFPETQHNLSGPFLGYWDGHGGLPVFGLPRSEAFDEVNSADGNTYTVQYFERNRIEHHPEFAGTPAEFLLGLLGVEQFTQTYGYTP